jgi:hypothetical protein
LMIVVQSIAASFRRHCRAGWRGVDKIFIAMKDKARRLGPDATDPTHDV